MPLLSLVVSTLGRTDPIEILLHSLAAQDCRDFEVILVDQNPDDRLAEILEPGRWPFPLRHLRTPGTFGSSQGRNTGARHGRGDILLFPDDDCWYPPWFLSKGVHLLRDHGGVMAAGRAADEAGRSINGRFQSKAGPIHRGNVWKTQIEWAVFIHRRVFEGIGGYDEKVGVGVGTPWGSCEAQDLTLRALAAGYRAYYDPGLYGHHPELPTARPDRAMIRKGRTYARGMGYVLRKHGFSWATAAYWMSRPVLGAAVSVLRGDLGRGRYQWNVAVGRYEGWVRLCLD